MKKHKLLIFLIALLSNSVLFAQKAADIQQGSLWLSNVKIDGKLNEWPSPLKAFNKATHCWYSVANDDQNLYLAIKSDRTNKIFSGGLTFTINQSSVTYPYNRSRDRTKKENRGPKKIGDQRLITDFKEIGISGIKSISDSVISIYNKYGIKVYINEEVENGEKIYKYELSIPLKLVEMNKGKEINYNIKLNGIKTLKGWPGGKIASISGKTNREMLEIDDKIKDLFYVTQFSGQYILAKKP